MSIKREIAEIMKDDTIPMVDTTDAEKEVEDTDFSILKEPFRGTDFEDEAGCLCNIVKAFTGRMNDDNNSLYQVIDALQPIMEKMEDIPEAPHMPYKEFHTNLRNLLDGNFDIQKAFNSEFPIETPSVPKKEPEANVGNAQAKLLELERYLQSMGLNNDKWESYKAKARQMAAVGDDTFNAVPELDRDDMEYLREKNRKQMKQQQGQAILGQGL